MAAHWSIGSPDPESSSFSATRASVSLGGMPTQETPSPPPRRALSGLDRLLADEQTLSRLTERQVGLLTNHASTAADDVPGSLALARRLSAAGGIPLRLFTPEHGMHLSAGAGEPVAHGTDPLTGLPVQSLYAGGGLNDNATFDGIDTLVIDLRDVGVRCYTYAATAARAARTALEQHIEVIVCDRTNPLGPGAEGPRPEESRRSLLAYFDVPFVHGHTIAELVSRTVAPAITDAPFLVYPTDIVLTADLGWTPPSPALSHPNAVANYAGLVLLEATNISEGRGSSQSFRSISAPGLDTDLLAGAMSNWNTGFRGVPTVVTHMRGDQAGQTLPGVAIWPRTGHRLYPLALGVHLLAWLRDNYRDFAWLPGPDGTPGGAIDNLFAHADLRESLNSGASAQDIIASWR